MHGWAIFLLAIIVFTYASSAVKAEERRQFYGGSLSYRVHKKSDGKNMLAIELITGWVTGKGPCGFNCTKADIGRSTKSSRQTVLGAHDQSWLGNFHLEHLVNGKTVLTEFIDTIMSNYTENVLALSMSAGWEQVILKSSFEMFNKSDSFDINYEGKSWKPLPLQSGTTDPDVVYWHFQITVSNKLRNDTGKHNNCPHSIARPFYRVKLDQVTPIRIPAVDEDGDIIKCQIAQYVEGGAIATHPPPYVTITENCTVYVNASEANGYVNDTWIGVPVSVRDYNRETIIYGTEEFKPATFSLSSTTVQFLVQILANLLTPVFVEPTLEGNHNFIMYADTTWRTEIYAEAVINTTIDEFSTIVIDNENVTISAPQEEGSSRPQVKFSAMSWKPLASDVGRHILCAQATDNNGVDTAEMRCFILDVLADKFTHSAIATPGKPYFVDIPSPDQLVNCKQQVTCVIPLYVYGDVEHYGLETIKHKPFRCFYGCHPENYHRIIKIWYWSAVTGQEVTEVSIESSKLDESKLGPIEHVSHKGVQLYKTDLSFSHSMHGKESICFQATDKNAVWSDVVCVKIRIVPPDPCVSAPCRNGGTCRKDEDTGGFTCTCFVKFSGKTCEIKDDPCKPDPCVPGQAVMCVGMRGILCYCKPGWEGDHCEKSVDDCAKRHVTCSGHGTCTDKHNDYECNCFSRYSGKNCEHDNCSSGYIDEFTCPSTPTSQVTTSTEPTTPSSFTSPSLTIGPSTKPTPEPVTTAMTTIAPIIQQTATTVTSTPTTHTADTNDCLPNPCKHGTCTDSVNDYLCNCEAGYTGKDCSTNINDCSPNPCQHGTCTDRVNDYSCNCEAGYTDKDCSTDINDCSPNPCQHGTCTDRVNDFSCNCEAGYTGKICSTDINDCSPNPCQHGTCTDSVNDYSCNCEVGYTGKNCSTELNGSKEMYIQVQEGSELVLNCSTYNATRQVNFHWSKMKNCDGLTDNQRGAVYRKTQASLGDAGTYSCRMTDIKSPENYQIKIFHVEISQTHTADTCSFDDGGLCSWTQLKNDKYDWTIYSGPTLSEGTGPDNDHTVGTPQGKYAYLEASAPRLMGENASLSSSLLPANHTMCFEFWYHMLGNGCGNLVVHIRDSCEQRKEELFAIKDDQGDRWHKASLTITAQQVPNDFTLVITADIGSTYKGDIAIDDLSLSEGTCTGNFGDPAIVG